MPRTVGSRRRLKKVSVTFLWPEHVVKRIDEIAYSKGDSRTATGLDLIQKALATEDLKR